MSIVTVQLGQCGNQVGLALFDAVVREVQSSPDAAFRRAAAARFFRRADNDVLPPELPYVPPAPPPGRRAASTGRRRPRAGSGSAGSRRGPPSTGSRRGSSERRTGGGASQRFGSGSGSSTTGAGSDGGDTGGAAGGGGGGGDVAGVADTDDDGAASDPEAAALEALNQRAAAALAKAARIRSGRGGGRGDSRGGRGRGRARGGVARGSRGGRGQTRADGRTAAGGGRQGRGTGAARGGGRGVGGRRATGAPPPVTAGGSRSRRDEPPPAGRTVAVPSPTAAPAGACVPHSPPAAPGRAPHPPRVGADTGGADTDSDAGTATGSDGADPLTERRERVVARAVLVDMEPKVIARCMEHTATWRYDRDRMLFQQSGSGNNWAHGYNRHGPRCAEGVVRLVQQEVDRTPSFAGFLLIQSVAGGTGSGFGTRMAETLRHAFPDALMLNCVVWPYDSGEVIVQHYNSLLTMAHLTRVSDAVLVIENDVVGAVCRNLLRIPAPSFHDLNAVISRYLAVVLLPATVSTTAAAPVSSTRKRPPVASGGPGASTATGAGAGAGVSEDLPDGVGLAPASTISRQLGLATLLSQLCAHPAYRIITVRMLPVMPPSSMQFSVHTWPGVMKHLHQMLVADAKLEEGINWRVHAGGPGSNKSVAAVVVLRGDRVATADATAFDSPALYPTWARQPVAVYRSTSHFGGYDKAAAVLSCCQAVVPLLERSLSRAFQMFEAGAFLHQYTAFGIGHTEFLAAFAHMEQLLFNYKTLS